MALDAGAAAVLEPHPSALSLGALRELEPKAEEAIARHRGPVRVDRLEALGTAALAARLVADGRREYGSLRRLSSMAATELARVSGALYLEGLFALDAATAEALAGHAGTLGLDGIAALDDEAAARLAAHRGPLSLAGLRRISSTARETLERHDGPLFLDGTVGVTPR